MKKRKYTITKRQLRAKAMKTKIDRNLELIESYEKGLTMQEVGKKYNMSRQSAHRIIDKGIEYYENLKKYLPGVNR